MAPAAQPQSQPEGGHDYVEGRLLDGFLMLAAGGSSTPDDVVSVNLSSLQIVDVAGEDLPFFVHLDRLDVSDNQLSYEHVLQQLAQLPRLGVLTLACNALSSIQVPGTSLRHLRSLDLSYNELHGDVLGQLACLPSLTRLDLSSNCISSVPPEEDLYGFRALEELILNANDLVQFIQWRALDALPQLRKLSMASNRIKRLKDDAPDTPGGSGASYFPLLEELDLSSNEIATCSALPALRLFQSLRVLNLNENPCTQGKSAEERLPGVIITTQASKPWYLQGSGCFQKRAKPTEPRLKLSRQKLRKVRSSQQLGAGRRQRGTLQVGLLDEEANRLLISLQPGGAGYAASSASAGRLPTVGLPSAPPGILEDDLSEEELDQILRERRAKIDRDFGAQTDEPPSFMRAAPFPADEVLGQKLGLWGRSEEELSSVGPGSPKRSPSSLFLTGLSEEGGEAAGPAARPSKPSSASGPPPAPASTAPPAPAAAAAPAPVPLTLPPIAPGSRGSSAGGGSRSDAADVLGRPRMPVPDVGVREAIRALRAAAMSEYAVAA